MLEMSRSMFLKLKMAGLSEELFLSLMILVTLRIKEFIQGGKMNKNRLSRDRMFLLIGIMFIIIVLTENVLALGITPGRTTINFEPGLKKEVQFSVLNAENKEMEVVFFVQGELNESIKLHKAKEKFKAEES